MAYENFTVETDGDGIALVTWDMPGRSMNVFTEKVMDELEAIVEAVAADENVKGAIIRSGKRDFSGGADITMIHALLSAFQGDAKPGQAAQRKLLEESEPHVAPLSAA